MESCLECEGSTKGLIFLWKYQNNIIPTKVLLAKRMALPNSDTKCVWCKYVDESQEHLFWHCSFIKKIWLDIISWWGIKESGHQISLSNIWNGQHLFKKSICKMGWNITLAATLWSIWLARNRLIFEKVSVQHEELIYLIKYRVFHWCEAIDICKGPISSGWLIDPKVLLLADNRAKMKSLLNSEFDLIGFIDGAFYKDSFISKKAGLGGFFKNNKGDLVYIFSGPAKGECPLMVELEALEHLISEVNNSDKRLSKIIIYSDCQILVDAMNNLRHGLLSNLSLSVDHLRNIVPSLNIVFGKISRNLNDGADDLAKQGIARQYLVGGWF